MNNLDLIVQKIRTEAEEKAAGCRARTDAEIQSLLDAADKEAAEKAAAITAAADAECRRIASRAESGAVMGRREMLLRAKVKKLEDAFGRAEASLTELSAEEYTTLLAGLLAGAMLERLGSVEHLVETYGETESAETPVFEAVFNEKDRAAVGDAVCREAVSRLGKAEPRFKKTHLAVSEKPASIAGGVILRYGDIETNCSLASLLGNVRTDREADVLRALFPVKE